MGDSSGKSIRLETVYFHRDSMLKAEWRRKAEEKREEQKRRLAAPRPSPAFPCPHRP